MTTSIVSRSRFWAAEILPTFLIAIVLIIVIWVGLFSRSSYEDERYNYGMVQRSVLPDAHYFLETSMVHVFYEKYPIRRPEDWHRGLPFVLLKLWETVVEPSNETLMRIPHVIWVLIWFALAVKLLMLLRGEEKDRSTRWKRLSSAFLLLSAISFSQLLVEIQEGFLDDIPTAVCVLCIVILLLQYDNSRLWLVITVGILAGFAFLMKDFGIIWFPIVGGWLVLHLLFIERPSSRLKKVLLIGAVFTISYLIPVVPKIIWNLNDLNSLFGQPASYMNLTHYFGEDIHYPYFLFNDTSYETRHHIPRGLRYTLTTTEAAFTDFSALWIWLIFPVAGICLKQQWNKREKSLFGFLILSILAFAAFFVVGLGEANVARYWLVQFTIAIALGINQGELLLESFYKRPNKAGKLFGACATAGFLLIMIFSFIQAPFAKLINDSHPISKQTENSVRANLQNGKAVMMDTTDAMYYWSLEPSSDVVGVYEKDWSYYSNNDDLRRFVDAYNIQVASYRSQDIINQLKAIGFQEIANDGDLTVLKKVDPVTIRNINRGLSNARDFWN